MESPQEFGQPGTPQSTGAHWLVVLLGIIALILVIALLGTVSYLSYFSKAFKPTPSPTPTVTPPTPTPTPIPLPSTNSVVEQSVTIIDPKAKVTPIATLTPAFEPAPSVVDRPANIVQDEIE